MKLKQFIFAFVAMLSLTFSAFAQSGVTTQDQLQEALNGGGNVTLDASITVTAPVTIPSDSEVVLNLNGMTLKAANAKTEVLENQGKLTINGQGTVSGIIYNGKDDKSTAEMTLNGGTYNLDGNSGGIHHYGKALTINDGVEVNTTSYGVRVSGKNSVLNLYGGTYTSTGTGDMRRPIAATKGTVNFFDKDITVKGNMHVMVGAVKINFGENNENSPFEAYHQGNSYGSSAFYCTTLQEAINRTGFPAVSLVKNVKVAADAPITVNKEIELNLNGHNLSAPAAKNPVLQNFANLTIEGKGTVKGAIYNGTSEKKDGAVLTLNGGTYQLDGANGGIFHYGKTLDINKGVTVKTAMYGVRVSNKGSVLNVNGGKFVGSSDLFNMQRAIAVDAGTVNFKDSDVDYTGVLYANRTNATINFGESNIFDVQYSEPKSAALYYAPKFDAALDYAKAGATLTLQKDIERSEILTLNKAITLDGNGKTLTSTAGRAINVDCADVVTIENLTIAGATGCERGINIINKPGTTNIDKVKVSGVSHYAVHVATSAGAAQVNIQNSDLTGYAAVAAYGEGGNVSVKSSNLVGINNYADNGSNSFSTIAVGSKVNVNVAGGSVKAVSQEGKDGQFVLGAQADVTGASITADAELITEGTAEYFGININKNTVNVRKDYAGDYVTSDAGNGLVTLKAGVVAQIGNAKYATLPAAISAAKAGETVTLLADVNLGNVTSSLSIKNGVVVDGQGYTVTINSVNESWNKAAFAPSGPVSYTIKNLTVDLKNAADGMAAFSLKYGGTLENVTVKGAFGQAVSATMSSTVTVTNCAFDGATWGVYASASNTKVNITGTAFNTTGAVYLHKYGELVFTGNMIAADSYIETEATVDVSQNFWNGNNATGSAPAATQLKGGNIICDTYYATNSNGVLGSLTNNGVAEDAVINIEIDGETYAYGPSRLSLISKLLGSDAQGANVKITLLADVALENGLQIAPYIESVDNIVAKAVEIDLNGKTLTGFIQINANVTATIQNGTVKNTNSSHSAIDVSGAVTLDKMTVESATKAFKVADGATLAVKEGTYSSDPTSYVAENYVTVENNGVWNVVNAVAKIGDKGYITLEEAFAAATEGQTITMLDDATPALTSQRAITKAAVIDLGGKTMTLTEDDLYFGTTTFKNGTIVVDPSVKPSTAVFWMFANQTLTFDNVKIVATGVTGTYLIGLDGNNSDLNLLNGSEILVENTTALDLDIICVNASTGNDIKVENSKVNVKNLDGRVFFRGNYTVKDSEVNLAGITKAGFRIEAGQTLSIEGTSKVNIEGEPRDGGINLIGATASYTKGESATVNATVTETGFEAKIGDVKYATFNEAVAAAQANETVAIHKAGTYKVPTGKNLTITGAVEDVKFANIGAHNMGGASMTFNNVTFEYGNENYKGLQHAGDLVYNNCTFNGQVFLYGQSETFNNCTFNQTSADAYNVWTYGAKEVDFNECTFNSAGKSVLIYHENATMFNDVAVTNSTFNASQTVAGKAAIEMDASLTAGINLTIDAATTATGFGAGNVSGNSLWNNKKGNADEANNDITVKVGDETVLAPVYEAKIGEKNYRNLQAAINAVQNDETITMLLDVTGNVTLTEKVGLHYTIDGAGNTMKGSINVKALSDTEDNRRITIKNINFVETDNAKSTTFISSVETNHYPHLTIEGCTFTGSGYEDDVDEDVAVTIKSAKGVVIKDCTGEGLHSFLQNTSGWNLTIEGVTVTNSNAGLALGTVQGVTIKGSTIDVATYGIRLDANTYNNNAAIEGNNVTAFIPVVVRNVNTQSNVTFTGENTFTAENTDGGKWMVIGKEEYEENGKLPAETAAGNVVVALNGNGLGYDGIHGAGLAGKGTAEAPYLINNVAELEIFRNSVNAGSAKYSKPGLCIALGADIDMTGVNWVGIGTATADHGFMGNFDGKNFKIKNLTIDNPALDSDGYAYAGLFGVTEGTDKNNQNTIKNLTIENVTINTTGDIVSAAIAYPYYTIVDNVKVCGDIKIQGGKYTAGVLAYTRRCVNASNLSIVGNDGSYVKGTQTVGGVISDIQMNGGLTAVYSNFSAEGIKVTGEKSVGGIAGIIATQTLNGATVKNVTLNSTDEFAGVVAGRLGGTSTISNVVSENVKGATAVIGATYDGAKAVEARIGDTYYATLDAALAAEGDEVELFVPVTVAKDETRVLDLNGKTVSHSKACTASYEMIKNLGNLTIKNGTLSFTDTSAGDPSFGWGSYTINNYGTLVVEEGAIIKHLGEQKFATHMIAAIQQAKGSTTINGGVISTPNYRSVRINGGALAINGGEFDGQVWLQPNQGDVTIAVAGGTFGPNGQDGSSIFMTNKGEKYTVAEASITGGTFTTKIGCSDVAKLAGVVTGGSFSASAVENTNSALIAAGYIFIAADADGYYNVIDDPKTHYITNIDELKAFRDEVNAGNTFAGIDVYLTADVDLADENWAPIGSDKDHAFKGTFDGQEHTVSNLKIENAELDCAGLFGYATGATIKNVNVKNVDIEAYSHVAAIAGYVYTGNVENCHVSGTINLVAQYAYSAGIAADGYVNVRNCSVIAEGTGVITVVEKTGAGGITGWRGEGDLVIENCTVKNLDITAWASLGGISGIVQYNNSVVGCTVENVKLTKTRENGQGSVGLVSGNWTKKASGDYTITVKDNKFNNVSINGTAINNLDQLLGSNYSEYITIPAENLVAENNTYGEITSNLKVVAKTLNDLKLALAHSKVGEIIELGADIEATEYLPISKSVTINGNGHKVTSSASRVFRVTTSETEVTLNDVNMVSTAVRVGQNDIRGISIDAQLQKVKLTLSNCSVDFTDASANDWSYAVNVSGNGTDHAVTVNGGTYEGANVINVNGANNTVFVKNATLTSLYPANDVYYGACIWVLQNQGSSVEAIGNTFNSNHAIAFNLGTGTTLTESDNTDNTKMYIAKVGTVYYHSVNEAINAAADEATVQLLRGTIDEAIAPWAGDSQHKFEKSITIVGAADFGTTLTGGMFLGYNDGTVRENTITVKGINFVGKGVVVANQKNVVIEGNKFTDINALVSDKHGNSNSAILVIGSKNDMSIAATVKNNVIENVANNAGIYMSQVAAVVVEGNTVTGTKHNSLTVSAATTATVNVANNTFAQWGLGGEGRAMRISGAATVNANENVMSHTATVPEEYVKVTDAKAFNASANYWNGNSLLTEGLLAGVADPLTVANSYYADAAKQNLVEFGGATSVAKLNGKYYTSFDEAYSVAKTGDVIDLFQTAVITNSKPWVNYSKKKITVNANFGDVAFRIQDGAYVWFGGMTVNSNDYCFIVGAEDASSGATVEFYGGTYNGETSVISVTKGDVKIMDGTFKAEPYEGSYEYTINCVDANYKNGTADVSIQGGKFYNFNPVNCAAEGAGTNFLVARYATTLDADGYWNVVPAVAQVGSNKYYATIAEAVQAAVTGDVVKIIANIKMTTANLATISDDYAVLVPVKEKAITIDLNGKSITVNASAEELADAKSQMLMSVFGIDTDGNLTLVDNTEEKAGSVKVNANGADVYSLAATYGEGAKLTIESGNYEADAVMASGSLIYAQQGMSIVVNDGNFKLDNYGTGANSSPWIFNTVGKNNCGITVNGGTYPNDINHKFWANEVYVPKEKALQANEDGTTWTVVDAIVYTTERGTSTGSYDRYVGYASFEEAFAAKKVKNTAIALARDLELTESVVVPADKTVTLDLNGKTASMNDASAAAAALIKNNGNLTIIDGTEEQAGKLSFKTTVPSAANAYASNTISNYGTLTIESGNVENLFVGGGACYALDNYAGSTATINGGKLTAEKTAVRIFNWTNGEAAKATLNVNGGEIISNDGYGINVNSGNAPYVALNITDGTITTNDTDYNLAVYVVNKNSAEHFTVNVTGGTFNGNFALNGLTATTMSADAVSVSGGTFEGVICYDEPRYGFVSGGTFMTEVATENVARNFQCFENDNETYTVERIAYDELTIVDGEDEYTNAREVTVTGKLTYKRCFEDTEWEALYLPFAVKYADIKEHFDVAYIYDAGYKNQEATINILEIEDEETVLEANYPYLIRAKVAGNNQIVIEQGAKLMPASVETVSCSSMFEIFNFTGVYQAQKIENVFVVDGEGWALTSEVNPFRFYMQITDRQGKAIVPEAKSIRMRSVNENGESTGLDKVGFDQNVDYIYDMMGRRVLEPKKGGLYIINGKKVLF